MQTSPKYLFPILCRILLSITMVKSDMVSPNDSPPLQPVNQSDTQWKNKMVLQSRHSRASKPSQQDFAPVKIDYVNVASYWYANESLVSDEIWEKIVSAKKLANARLGSMLMGVPLKDIRLNRTLTDNGQACKIPQCG